MVKHIFCTLFVVAAFAQAQAAHHEVKMLDNGKDGMMVFEPAVLKVNKGDTVKFVPTNPSHDVASLEIPKGAKSWSGAVDKAVTITIEKEGVYLYECRSHIAMAMVGLLYAGKPDNLEAVKKAAKTVAPKFVMNKDRLDKYISQVK